MTTAHTDAPEVLTKAQSRRKERDRKMLHDYVRLLEKDPGRSRMALYAFLLEKYCMASLSGLRTALMRAASDSDTPKRLAEAYARLRER